MNKGHLTQPKTKEQPHAAVSPPPLDLHPTLQTLSRPPGSKTPQELVCRTSESLGKLHKPQAMLYTFKLHTSTGVCDPPKSDGT